MKNKTVENLPIDINDLETLKRVFQVLDLPIEIMNVYWVYEFGALKHGRGSWRDANNKSMEDLNNLKSTVGHVVNATYGPDKNDSDTGISHWYHVIARASMKVARPTYSITNFKEIDKL